MQPQPPPGSSHNRPGQAGDPQDGTGNPPPQSGYPSGQYAYPQWDEAGYPQQQQPVGYPQTGYPQASEPTARISPGQAPAGQVPWGQQDGYPQQDQTAYLQQGLPVDDRAAYPQQSLPGADRDVRSPDRAAYPNQQDFAPEGYPHSGQTGYPQGQSIPNGSYDPSAYPPGPMRIPAAQPQSFGSGAGATAGRIGRRLLGRFGSLIGLAIVVGVIYLISWGCHQINKPDAEKVQVGQCVKVAGTTNDPKVDITDCGSIDANYKVVEREDKSTAPCPDSNDASVWETGSGGYNLCLQLNVQQGDCLNKESDNTTKVLCDSSDVTYKVTDVLTGTTSDSGCSNSAGKYLTYAKPDPMVVCLSSVQ